MLPSTARDRTRTAAGERTLVALLAPAAVALAAAALRALWPVCWPIALAGLVAVWLLAEGRLSRRRLRAEDAGPLDASLADSLEAFAREHAGREVRFCRFGGPRWRGVAAAALTAEHQGLTIWFSDDLLELLSPPELRVVAAHELGHALAAPARWKLAALKVLGLIAAVGALWAAIETFVPQAPPSGWILWILAGLLASAYAVSLGGHAAASAWQRREERRANDWALEATNDPEAFVSTMRKLAEHNGAASRPAWWRRPWMPHAPLECILAQGRSFAAGERPCRKTAPTATRA